jgi:hypothetical protein
MKLDSALSGISSACGLSYQTTALARNPAPSLSGLEASASRDADKLASVYAGNPGWLYQGETITTIVDDSISLLGECGLVESRAKLVKLTGQAGGGCSPPRRRVRRMTARVSRLHGGGVL